MVQKRKMMMKKIEAGDMKDGELVNKIQMNESKVGEVARSARCGQEECRNQSRMRCRQSLVRKMSSSSALTTSLERSCLDSL